MKATKSIEKIVPDKTWFMKQKVNPFMTEADII